MAGRVDSDRASSRILRRGTTWLGISVLLAVAISLLLLFVPLTSSVGMSTEHLLPGQTEDAQPSESRDSLLETEGWSVVGIMVIPVALCAAPLLTQRRARYPVALGSTVLLGAAVLVGSASIGLFYLPAVVTMAIAKFALPRGNPPA